MVKKETAAFDLETEVLKVIVTSGLCLMTEEKYSTPLIPGAETVYWQRMIVCVC